MRFLRGEIFFIFFLNLLSLSAEELALSDFEKDSLQAIEFGNEGMASYRKGDFEASIDFFTKSFNLRKKLYGENSIQLFRPLTNLGIPLKTLGEYDKAIESYLLAEKIIIDHYQSDNHPRLGFVYANLGNVYKLQGDYVKNHEFQQAALRVLKNDSLRYKKRIFNAIYNIVEANFLLNRYDQAIRICNENISFVDEEYKSFYFSLLARIYMRKDEYDLANDYYLKALDILKKLRGTDHYELGLEYNNYVSFLLEIGDFENAFTYNHLAEAITEKYFSKKSNEYSNIMINYADYYFLRSSEASGIHDFNLKRKEDLQQALGYYQQAIISATEDFETTNIFTNPGHSQAISQIQLLEIIKKKASCFEVIADLNMSVFNRESARVHYQAALETIELATELVHQIRTGYVSEDSRFFLAENQDETFIDAVNIAYKLYRLTDEQQYAEKGFEFTEKSKSASFLAAVKDSRAKEFGGIPDSLLNQEDNLKRYISTYREMVFEEKQTGDPDSARLSLYNSKIFQLNEQYQQLIHHFEDSFPNYYSFKYENEVVDIDEVKRNISEKEALVEYLIEEPSDDQDIGKIFKFIITHDEIQFVSNTVEADFVEDIEYLHGFLTSSNYLYTGLDEYKGYVKAAYNLYSTLLDSDSDILEGKKLIVVPDDKLSYIPFDAMLTSESDTNKLNFRTLPYLVKDYSVSYTYSATLLFNYFENEKKAKKDLLAFAPVYTGTGILNENVNGDSLRNTLLPIPAAYQEVNLIGKYISTDKFIDSLAQERIFKELASEYDILHLAMHTIINDTLPMFSKLAFSSPDPDDPEDGWLNTNEIYTMDLNARMAVLSACNTGSGKLQKGEGVMSLARGFLYAGCPSIVMTLWEVEDESGANIMSDFYRLLSKGKSKNEALRLAKLAHIEHADPLKAHPHYWLGYVAVGNHDPLYFSKDIYFILVVFGLFVLLLADQLYRKRARRKPGAVTSGWFSKRRKPGNNRAFN